MCKFEQNAACTWHLIHVVNCKLMWIQCFYVKYGQEACMFLCTKVYEMPCTSCIMFKLALHIQSNSTFTCTKVAKKPVLLCIMFSSFGFITLLHVFSHHIQSVSTFTRAKVAKKPALLCKMFSSFVSDWIFTRAFMNRIWPRSLVYSVYVVS